MSTRDDAFSSEQVARTIEYSVGSPTTTYISNFTADRARSLPVGTNPGDDGEFFLPTVYRAHRWVGEGADMNYTIRSSGGTRRTIRGKSATGDWSWPLRTWGMYTGVRPYTVEVPYAVISKAELSALSSLKEGSNLAVMAAEMNKSLRTIAELLRVIRSLIRTWRLKHTKEEISAWWLTYRYFFQTTMMDIYDTMAGMRNLLGKPEFLIGDGTSIDPDFGIWSTAPTNWWRHNATGKFRRGCNVRVVARVTNPFLYDLDAFGLVNPLDLAWELIPFSFVVDWFVSIGPWLRSLSLPIGMSFSTGYRTLWLKYNYEIEYLPTGKAAGATLTNVKSPARLTGKVDAFNRSVYSEFPKPWPAIDFHLTTSQCLDALALLVQTSRR